MRTVKKRRPYAIILGQRFVVALSGDEMSMADLESAAKSLDLAALEAMK